MVILGSSLSRVREILTASPPHSLASTTLTLDVSPGLKRLSPSVSFKKLVALTLSAG